MSYEFVVNFPTGHKLRLGMTGERTAEGQQVFEETKAQMLFDFETLTSSGHSADDAVMIISKAFVKCVQESNRLFGKAS